jgi:hypothetical protein
MKSLKNLFIKEDEEQEAPAKEEKLAFPVGGTESFPGQNQKMTPSTSTNPYFEEIIEVYEKGLNSINMPGYDFYDFFLAIKAAGSQNEAVYKMAFQMGKAMDGNITSQKLSNDAEYYVSKINEVHQTYSQQGNSKLSSLESELRKEKDSLAAEISQMEINVNKMKQEIIAIEQRLLQTRSTLNGVESKYKPQQDEIRQKLIANDQAMETSIQRLNAVKEGIIKFIK